MNKQELIAELISRGWQSDLFGNFHKTVQNKTPNGQHVCERELRILLKNNIVRIEVLAIYEESTYAPEHREWIRLSSCTYKQLTHRGPFLVIGTQLVGQKHGALIPA